ncbi:PREDICTED: uncharacterized protein LOC106743807 [Dinoponera quadriceps]|uniref:Uncharacterized protein LOC106743807 n=1 Tax=Dinoponera quadriceps TaxID=609295 RepID=A0A6P3X5B3_DINQU|nr:PREDICTED: uncharacterized protein LOC106743807 [Dinoponera quadriceps]
MNDTFARPPYRHHHFLGVKIRFWNKIDGKRTACAQTNSRAFVYVSSSRSSILQSNIDVLRLDVLFSDESRFCLYSPDGRERVYHRIGERFTDCMKHGDLSQMPVVHTLIVHKHMGPTV